MLIDCGINERSRAILRASYRNLSIHASPGGLENLPNPGVGSHATYARLLLGMMFPQFARIIYLDADTVALSDLNALDHLRFEDDMIIAACAEPYTPTFAAENGVADYESLGFMPECPYFNAGVMVVNVQRWNNASVMEQSIRYLRRQHGRICLFDQEALNVALAGSWQRLSPEWNVTRYWMKEERRSACPEVLTNAQIAHFLSSAKPWLDPNEVHPWLLTRFIRYSLDCSGVLDPNNADRAVGT